MISKCLFLKMEIAYPEQIDDIYRFMGNVMLSILKQEIMMIMLKNM